MTEILKKYILEFNIIPRKTHVITFHEIISIFFYLFHFSEKESWKEYYHEFLKELTLQNRQWPMMDVIVSNFNKRLDIMILKNSFLPSRNFLVLLFRLLYIEHFKKECYPEYTGILNHEYSLNKNIIDLTIHDIVNLLQKSIFCYMVVYSQDNYNIPEIEKNINPIEEIFKKSDYFQFFISKNRANSFFQNFLSYEKGDDSLNDSLMEYKLAKLLLYAL